MRHYFQLIRGPGIVRASERVLRWCS